MIPELQRPDWHQHAACRSEHLDLFFPSVTESDTQMRQGRPDTASAPGKRVCAACPVRAECLDYAITHNIHHGTWGGLSELERRIFQRRRTDQPA